LIDSALQRNLDLQIISQKIEIAQNEYRVSKSQLLPTVNAQMMTNPRKFGYYTMDDAGNRVTEIFPGRLVPTHLPDYFAGLQTSWEIDVWGKLNNRKKSSLSRFLSEVEGKNAWTTYLIEKISVLYFDLLATDIELAIIEKSLKLQLDALEIMRVKMSVGQVNALSVKQFEALVAHSQSEKVGLEQKTVLLENEINGWLNRYPQPIKRSPVFFEQDTMFGPLYTGIPSDLLQLRPDIRSAELLLRASEFDVRAAKAALYPSFNIQGFLGFQAFSTQFLLNFPQSLAYNFLGSLTGPLINRAAIKAHFNKASAQQMEQLLRYQKAILDGYLEVASELSNLEYINRMDTLKERESEALNQAVEISRDLFLGGKATYLEVLSAQRDALDANRESIQIKKMRMASNIHLYKALGGGWR
jgi:NodT family efflux transporter outer membrane factor (OMF) lipoprotein